MFKIDILLPFYAFCDNANLQMFCYSHIYFKIVPLQKADLQYCSSALVFENLEENTLVKEFNFIAKVSSVGPATILKNELFHSLFFKLFEHIAEELFWKTLFGGSFRRNFTGKTFHRKIQVKYWLQHFL